MKRKFRVWARCSNYCYLDVDAENEEEALEIGENTDCGDFIPDDDPYSGSWEITHADELDPESA